MIEKLKKLREIQPDKYIMRILAAWCVVSMNMIILAKGKFVNLDNFAKISIVRFASEFIIVYVLITAAVHIFRKREKFELYLLPVTFTMYSVLLIMLSQNWYFCFAIIALYAVMIYYYAKKGYIAVTHAPEKTATVAAISVLSAIFIIIVGTTCVLRYTNFISPNFDFGLFCNMFYNMKEHFAPLTTCERDTLLSHFAVHLSPIYYLILPFYLIFPSGATLQLAQVIILASAVIPLALLAKKYGLSNIKTIVISAVLLFYPAVASGTNYDLHENCFLLPLLLWVFYFFETERYIPMAVFALLTLTVKEDAAVYIIFFALYVILSRKKYLCGILLMLGAGLYFGGALLYLSHFGQGVMANRYGNFITDGGGLFEAVKNVLVNPGYVFTQLFVDKDGGYEEKFLFILQLFVPLAFLPLNVKKISRLILLFPMLLLNLMTVYLYQYDIGFQYTFGVIAFLFYLSVINVSEMEPLPAKTALSVAAVASVLIFFMTAFPQFTGRINTAFENREDYKIMNAALDEIPDDASVICSTRLLAHLCNRDEIYEVHYHKVRDGEVMDYVILDMREKYENFKVEYEALGYKPVKTVSNGDSDLMLIMEPTDTVGTVTQKEAQKIVSDATGENVTAGAVTGTPDAETSLG